MFLSDLNVIISSNINTFFVLHYRLQNAQQEQDSKTVCCCCCESGPITAVLRIDRTGFVPGEVISCNAEINDGSGHGTASSKVKLKMVIF